MEIKKFVVECLIFTVIFSAGIICVLGQENSSDPRNKRITIKMENEPFGDIIDYLIKNYDVAIGFEESTLDTNHNDYEFETNLSVSRKMIDSNSNVQISVSSNRVYKVRENRFTINAENEKLEDVLNKIVKQMKNYKWEINEGVVNIFPIRGRNSKFEKLLETKVSKFQLEKNQRISLIRTLLFEMPEFKDFLLKNNLFILRNRSGLLEKLFRPIPAELNFSNLTFKELLNKITKIKRGGWIVKKSGQYGEKGKQYIDIDI